VVPTDYVAAVYGSEAAERYIAEIGIRDESLKEKLCQRAQAVSRVGLSAGLGIMNDKPERGS
jgi:hypothetical protein